MDYFVQFVKVTSLKMVPFISAVTMYFMLGTYELENRGKLWSTTMKILPIISLMVFVLFYGTNTKKSNRSSKFILVGLIFSAIGDILLNHDLFQEGMGAFAFAQIFYITSFGFTPLRPIIGIVLYSLEAAAVSLFFKNLPAILKIGLPIYGTLLLTMCWRALARGIVNASDMKYFPKLICAIGSVLFVISDSLIAFDKFYIPLSFAPLYIMITYYAAQFGIVLSIVEFETSETNNNNKKTFAKRGKNIKQKAQ